MPDTTPKDSTVLTIGWVRAVVGGLVVFTAFASQWFYLTMQVQQNKQLVEENRQLILKMQEKLDEKVDEKVFELRHQDLQHRVDNLEDFNKQRK